MADTAEELTILPLGWDGYDGVPVTLNNCNRANRIAEVLELELGKPEFVPAGDGSIQIEWHTKDYTVEIFIGDHTTKGCSDNG